MASKNTRSVKIYGMSGYKHQATPTIMLKGKWLEELGFEIGDYITVSCEDGRIIITPDTERAALAKAEQEFLDREMASLNNLIALCKSCHGAIHAKRADYWGRTMSSGHRSCADRSGAETHRG